MKLYWHLFDALITNAVIVYKAIHPNSKMNNVHFRQTLVKEIVAKYGKLSDNKRTPQDNQSFKGNQSCRKKLSIRSEHELISIPPTPNTQYPTKRCVVCYENGIRKQVRNTCKNCKVALCKDTCFDKYHEL